MSNDEQTIRCRVTIRGRVQGVFFRDSARQEAEDAGVSGQARNLSDGSVELILEGPAQDVERVIDFSRRGPDRARVEGVEVKHEEPQGLHSFEIV